MEKSVADFILNFVSIFFEALPFIVLGAVIAGILEELIPQQALARFIPRSPLKAICISGLLGIVFPMCECGIIVVMRRLLRKGLPLSCCVAYILAGPIINPVVMLSTYYAFKNYEPYQMGGFWMVGLRVGLGYVIACVTALVIEGEWRKHGLALLAPSALPPVQTEADVEEEAKESPRSFMERLGNISATALHDFVDITVFLILGALLAAMMREILLSHNVDHFSNPIIAILFMMMMAVLLCLCSEADAFVAANVASVVPAAKLAFLVLGPMLDLKLYLMYTRVFRPRLIWTIIVCVVSQTFLYSWLTHFVWEAWMNPANVSQ